MKMMMMLDDPNDARSYEAWMNDMATQEPRNPRGRQAQGGFMSRQVMQQALDALQYNHSPDNLSYDYIQEVIEALRAELAKPEPEPVGYVREEDLEQMKRTSSAWLYREPSGIAGLAFPVYRWED
jgi:hypothetical protein